ncbi:hypothetical protein ACFO4E_00580 [Nocardiopsis mangrovi]|uniref:DUF8017 domain-containing protein n=1 Tax=Nocardiopsis mangrovi TaxID=1179818 RepID=A0ABV9DPI5_9ACTN
MTWQNHSGGWGSPPSLRGTSPLVVSVLTVILVAVLIATVLVLWDRWGPGRPDAAPDPSPDGDPPTAQAADDAPEPTPTPSPSPDEALINPGWRTAAADDWGLVYEVPTYDEGWRVRGELISVGDDGEGGPVTAMGAASIYLDSPCPGWGNRAAAGVQGLLETQDTEDMAEGVALTWGEESFHTDAGEPRAELRSVEEFAGNGLTGHRAVVDVTLADPDGTCEPPTAEVHTVAVPNPREDNAVRAFTLVVDTGIADRVSDDDIEAIIGSLRDQDREVG